MSLTITLDKTENKVDNTWLIGKQVEANSVEILPKSDKLKISFQEGFYYIEVEDRKMRVESNLAININDTILKIELTQNNNQNNTLPKTTQSLIQHLYGHDISHSITAATAARYSEVNEEFILNPAINGELIQAEPSRNKEGNILRDLGFE